MPTNAGVVLKHGASLRMNKNRFGLVFCRVKFGAFYEYLAIHQDHKFDRIASGHYARIIRGDDADESVRLALAPDAVKDQTYFLAHLTQSQLSRVMFPLGSLNKVCAVLRCAAPCPCPCRAVPCCAVLCCAVLCCAVLCCNLKAVASGVDVSKFSLRPTKVQASG